MSAPVEERKATDKQWFRQVLGQYPTGVCVVTAAPSDGPPAGMVVGSFTSVSLDPPLVAFFPDKGSSSWPKIERAGTFCVNILGEDQESVCRRFASRVADKFEGQQHRPAGTGSPIIQDVVAWIDCDIQAVQEAGDHFIVLGRVRDLQIESSRLPLLSRMVSKYPTLPAGNADEVSRQIEQAQDRLGFNQLFLMFGQGHLEPGQNMEELSQFIDQVAPHFSAKDREGTRQ
jgi:flavin reductase (DIM6/NTAB) family NADH-FMN oxidoreductase RutF